MICSPTVTSTPSAPVRGRDFPPIRPLRRIPCGGRTCTGSGPAGTGYLLSSSGRRTEECGTMSGTDKLTNKIEEVSGKGKQAVGDATDNRDLQAEGNKEETKSNLKQAGEKVKDAFK